MCALTPFPISNWPLVNPIGHGHMYNHELGNESIDSIFLPFPPPQTEDFLLDHQSPSLTAQTSSCAVDAGMVRKLNHNASERGRRKKVNNLYSSLGSLLPAAHQMKKLSFPATVSHALKYIPELQQQVEGLVQKKEKLLLRISQQRKITTTTTRISGRGSVSSSTASAATVSINRLTESEIGIQISMHKTDYKNRLSEILQLLELDGRFLLLNVNCFEPSVGGMVFYNIHLQVENTCKFESEALNDKLLSLLDVKKELLIHY